MAINQNPVWSGIGNISAVIPTAANTSSQGGGTIGTDIFKAFTADATYGSWASRIRLTPTSTAASTPTAATVIRVFVSSQASGATTSANTWLIKEIALGAQTADSPTAATFSIEEPLNFAMDPSFTILVTTHTANAANTGWQCVVFGGKYTQQ